NQRIRPSGRASAQCTTSTSMDSNPRRPASTPPHLHLYPNLDPNPNFQTPTFRLEPRPSVTLTHTLTLTLTITLIFIPPHHHLRTSPPRTRTEVAPIQCYL